MKFILASASPRRKELLSKAGFEYEVCPADIDETLPDGINAEEAVRILAEKKAAYVLEKNPGAVVLGADTVVVLDGKILGKPKDAEDAKIMLMSLSGREHKVCTGICVCSAEKKISKTESAKVYFYPFGEKTAERYVESGEPMDKAGAYGIQGIGSVLVRKIDGDFFTIMGLPIAEAVRMLSEFSVTGIFETL